MTDISRPVRILIVCTGNICRSAYAELLLQAELDAMAPGEFEVGSAGTMGLRNKPVNPPLDSYLEKRGIDHTDFESRRMTTPLLEMADVVLGLTTEHRDEVLRRTPSLLKRSFTLREFQAILQGILDGDSSAYEGLSAAERWRTVTQHAARARSRVNAELDSPDIEDPYGREIEMYETAAAEIEEAVATIAGFERAMRGVSAVAAERSEA
ncbi:low molecular weight phosphatase family protein [Falsarthrobacter nasiphocae]|uniref:Protein-tyrosine phosphatase n=1 Tax=Falsarthrobacter nasiphocae TaxID=189863 RepID=A0AAE3YIN5_9MICC|nr:low molecular weight phosphatase family protein [Falsarthrobacter nasiphocae]MDR6892663.1 protein-tyrosine phosphatase [Falsarthrobacter nasiphocae]